MVKKTRKEKELAQLRREAEVLKAQLEETGKPEEAAKALKQNPSEKETQRVDPKYIKSDLIKAGILTGISIAVIALLYIFRNQMPFI